MRDGRSVKPALVPGFRPRAVVVPPVADKAVSVAAEVAQRLRDRRNVEAACAAAAQQTAFLQTVGWQPVSLAQGMRDWL